MSDRPTEETNLPELYGIDANHESDLKSQIEKIAAFETAANSGDWKLFKQIVNQSGKIFLKLMRSADGDPRLKLPLFQSGELEESFTRSLQSLNRDWTHLMPLWARFGYRFEIALTWISVAIVFGAAGVSITGDTALGGILGGVAIVILVLVDNAEPGVRSYSRWWVRIVYPKPRPGLGRWRTASYVLSTLAIMWFLLAPTFKTSQDYCSGLSPEEYATRQGCGADDPFAQ